MNAKAFRPPAIKPKAAVVLEAEARACPVLARPNRSSQDDLRTPVSAVRRSARSNDQPAQLSSAMREVHPAGSL